MRLSPKIALGVDISETLISMALLKRVGKGFRLLKTASCPVPDGAIKNGSIEDAKALTKAVRRLKNRITIRSIPASVSLFVQPVIMQIMDISREVPSNIRQFVHSQMKHCVALPGRKIDLDFCGTSGVGSESGVASRVLAVAADGQKVAEITRVCGRAGMIVEAIEPPLIAYIRALHSKRIVGRFDCNVLIAILRENTLTLCVFRRQNLDFVRTNNISPEKSQPGELRAWLAEQINTVTQFYDVEVPDSYGKWEITVVTDDVQLPENAEDSLRANVAGSDLQVLTGKDVGQATAVSQSGRSADSDKNNRPSLIAVGLAMKILDTNKRGLSINLLPQEITRLRVIQKEAFVTLNIIAAVLLVMLLVVNGPFWRIKRLNESIKHKRAALSRNTDTLVKERIWLDGKIDTLNRKLEQTNKMLGSHSTTDWPGLMSDIGKEMPKTVCITGLTSKTDSAMSLEGLAISNEDVYLFVDKLNKSKYIDSASIVETEKDISKNGVIKYEINCSLAAKEKG